MTVPKDARRVVYFPEWFTDLMLDRARALYPQYRFQRCSPDRERMSPRRIHE